MNRINRLFKNGIFLGTLCAIALILLAFVVFWSVGPANFPGKRIISLKEGSTLSQAADTFAGQGIVKSAFIYKVYVVLLGGKRKVIAGDYLFDSPQSALHVAYRTVHGLLDMPRVKITLPEGIAVSDISRLLAKNITGFDAKDFLALARPQEGYLFPDTYYFYDSTTPEQMVSQMRANFDKKTKNLTIPVALSGKSFKDVLTMASIVEKEATSSVDRRIIAGILWKRIEQGMALQVDPPFFYYLGKRSQDLTLDDLADDSPYNLYKHKGLPPTPIGNPGLDTIVDTLNPVETKYWFYLSDVHGVTHYAETHEGHLANKEKYLQ